MSKILLLLPLLVLSHYPSLISITDTLKIDNDHHFDLQQLQQWTKNMTIDGALCYAKSIADYKSNCVEKMSPKKAKGLS